MCGRFALGIPPYNIVQYLNMEDMVDFRPRYNIAPTQEVQAVVRGDDGAAFASLRWGLAPSWAKDPAIGSRMINARAETVAEKPSFRAAFRHRRCLIPATGFYEWARLPEGRMPYYAQLADTDVFAFAGLWERWRGGAGEIASCAIITTSANDLMRPVHDRMPVILPPDAYGRWLGLEAASPEQCAELLAPYPSEAMTLHSVSTAVNSPKSEGPELILPVGSDEGV